MPQQINCFHEQYQIILFHIDAFLYNTEVNKLEWKPTEKCLISIIFERSIHLRVKIGRQLNYDSKKSGKTESKKS